MVKTREEALQVLRQYNKSDALIRHAYAVEGVMRHFAEKFGEDAGYWGLVGLLHDVDYEQWPEEHLKIAPKLLSEAGFANPACIKIDGSPYWIVQASKP